ncbi:hypothetical protein PSTT_05569 [Puccinia striiformis]|uniref:Uncharacterized protein n=1 Tax=Puccinia striiformis TaxID=27350 RepID=A0A2S4VNJ5_9BASI|nr:hypothetical protein PSTT_05569 [Puccinia striiformis]
MSSTTDFEEHPLKNRKQGRKHCNILGVPWRNSKLTQIFILLDEISVLEKESSLTKPSGPPPRVCRQIEHPPPASLDSSPGLPEDCYSSRWRKKLKPSQLRALKPSTPCNLKRIARKIQAAVSTPSHS